MKPNFALSLSFEGIRLLHRTGAGPTSVWTLVGEVAIDAPDLTSQLAMLRKTGLALDPQGLRTKLLIPNDQIKYLSLDTTRAGDDDVRAALDGATPYAVSDLTFDYVRGGGRTYIAAIARETLAEAEAFAAEHRFGPVSFAGVPAPFTYVGEPFFGPTSIAERLLGPGQRAERDEVAVAYQSNPRMPGLALEIAGTSEVALNSADHMAAPAPIEPTSTDVSGAVRPAPHSATTDGLDGSAVLPEQAIPIQSDRIEAAVALSKTLSSPHAPIVVKVAAIVENPGVETSTEQTPALPSERDPDHSDKVAESLASLGSDAENDQRPDQPDMITVADAHFMPDPTMPDLKQAFNVPSEQSDLVSRPISADDHPAPLVSLTPEPVFASRARPLRADPGAIPGPIKPLVPPPGSRVPGPKSDTSPVFSRRTEPPLTRPVAASLNETGPDLTGGEPKQNGPATAMSQAPEVKGLAFGSDAPGFPNGLGPRPEIAVGAVLETGSPQSRVPGGVTAPAVIPIHHNPDYVGSNNANAITLQVVTATADSSEPGLVIAGSALQAGKIGPTAIRPSADRVGEIVTRLTPQTQQSQLSQRPVSRPSNAPIASDKPKRGGKSKYLALILTLVLLAFMAAVAAWASFLTDTGLAGLFSAGTTTNAPQTASDGANPISVPEMMVTTLLVPADSLETDLPSSAEDAESAPEPSALPDLSVPDVSIDSVAAIPAEPVIPDASIQQQNSVASDDGAVVSPAEADRIYAATGVWLRAPRLPLIPTSDPIGDLARAVLDVGVNPVGLPVMPTLAGAAPDQSMLTPIDPPAPGTVFERDARGFILATAEGTLTPDGILVFAGAPSLVPPNRPGTPEPVAVVQAAPRIIAASAPPLAPRPDPVVPETVSADPATVPPADTAATAGGVGLDSLGPTIRPLQRPGGLIPEVAQPEVAAPVLVAFAGPAPQLRPVGLTPQTVALPDPATDPSLAIEDTVAAIMAAAPPEPVTSDSPLAVASARIPEARPQNFAEVVASAQPRQPPAEPQNPSLAVIDPPPEPPTPEPAPEPVPEPVPEQPAAQPELLPESAIADETVAPSGPIPGGVAANATLAAAVDLRAVNLIGVFGRPNDRRALVRLANGSFVRVGVGDSLDGGQVAAIGDNALNYVKRGQTITIAIPNG